MTNEWGAPLTGDEMKALEGRIDPETPVCLLDPWEEKEVYSFWNYDSNGYHTPANHPYYKVREYNQKHGTNLVLHDGSAKVPEDWDEDGRCLYRDGGVLWIDTGPEDWTEIIAYTPKPKESEVTEQFPSDEAIEYVLRDGKYRNFTTDFVRGHARDYPAILLAARLIQQYEPDRLKSAVDVAAEEYAVSEWTDEWEYEGHRKLTVRDFKAGAEWQKENGNG